MDIIKIKKAMALLQSLRQNLPDGDIEEIYVSKYHTNLSVVQNEIGVSFAEFQIPYHLLNQEVTGYQPRIAYLNQKEETHYSNERYCPREFFLTKITGAIGFLNSLTPDPEKKKPGFS